ncbi:MAG: hypothetical protein WC015_07255 [Methanoregula sp.]
MISNNRETVGGGISSSPLPGTVLVYSCLNKSKEYLGIPGVNVTILKRYGILMMLTTEQETVLGTIFELGKGSVTTPVTISAIHGTFSNMNVSDLVRHLEILIKYRFIDNAQKTTERLSNTFVITPEGIKYYNENIKKRL